MGAKRSRASRERDIREEIATSRRESSRGNSYKIESYLKVRVERALFCAVRGK